MYYYYYPHDLEDFWFWAAVECRKDGRSYSSLERGEMFNGVDFIRDGR